MFFQHMTVLEGQSAEHLHSQQKFLSSALKTAQQDKDKLSNRFPIKNSFT